MTVIKRNAMNKDILLIICAVITAVSLLCAVYVFGKQGKLAKSLEEERYGRMVAEESSQKSATKLAALENQIKSTDGKMAKLKDILDQEKSVNSDLKNQYDKLSQAKADLESKLKTAMEEKAAAVVPEVQPVKQEVVPEAVVTTGAQ